MKENSNNQNVNEFSLEERIFNFAYKMALRDATLQQSYKGTDKKSLRANNEARGFVSEYIEAIFNGMQPCFYDTETKVENSFRDFIKNKKLTTEKGTLAEFTFGNAQKLINMTAKYMYISAYANDGIRERFQCCHCPMDSIMVDRLKIKIAENVEADQTFKVRIIQLAKEFNESGKWKTFLSKPWSGITSSNCTQYTLFQSLVSILAQREHILPIEFDYKYWDT